jgi:hypothetical protein
MMREPASCAPIVVVVTGADDVHDTLTAGIELADRRRSRLVIISLAVPLPWIAYTTLLAVGWAPEWMRQLAIADAEEVRVAAVARVPRWIPVESRVLCRSPRDAVATLVSGGLPQALVMHRKRIRRQWTRRVRRLAEAGGGELHLAGAAYVR